MIRANHNPEALPAPPPPSVSPTELRQRLANLRSAMEADGIDWLLMSDRKNIGYVSDYRSLSWAYHSRPMFCLVSPTELVLVASRIETRNLALAVRSFNVVFYDGYEAEAIDACRTVICSAGSTGSVRIALDYGQDMFGRGSVNLIEMIRALSPAISLVSGSALIWRVRMIKSEFEVELKRRSFEIVNAAFDDAIAAANIGISEVALCRDIQARIMRFGADQAEAIAMTFGRGDLVYNRPPGSRSLSEGDYLWTDFRAPYGGYPADRNRIARAGVPAAWEQKTYDVVRNLTVELAAGIAPGMLCRDVFETYQELWSSANLPTPYGLVSRIGHGGGLDVTEPPSISSSDLTVIQPGMILHLEPKLELNGAVFQFEEIVHVREQGAEFISALSPERLPLILRK